jgi:hypothetical protein
MLGFCATLVKLRLASVGGSFVRTVAGPPQRAVHLFRGPPHQQAVCTILFSPIGDCPELLSSQNNLGSPLHLAAQVARPSLPDLCPATRYPCMARMEAQVALASWRKARMEVPQAPAPSWRRAHTEAQAVAASEHAPRLALLLDKGLAVREICLLW